MNENLETIYSCMCFRESERAVCCRSIYYVQLKSFQIEQFVCLCLCVCVWELEGYKWHHIVG